MVAMSLELTIPAVFRRPHQRLAGRRFELAIAPAVASGCFDRAARCGRF